jgi:hypothetical protein
MSVHAVDGVQFHCSTGLSTVYVYLAYRSYFVQTVLLLFFVVVCCLLLRCRTGIIAYHSEYKRPTRRGVQKLHMEKTEVWRSRILGFMGGSRMIPRS